VDIYTGLPLTNRLVLETLSSAHVHPDPPTRWEGSRGFGIRHINDSISFSLWSDKDQEFRHATLQESQHIMRKYNAMRVEFRDNFVIIETNDPSKPIPLTVASVPAVFLPPSQRLRSLYGLSPAAGPRVPDSCPHLSCGRMKTPQKSQMLQVTVVIAELGNIHKVNFFPTSIVVELVHGDGRVYPKTSLPGIVAGLCTTYHHAPTSFFEAMKDRTRERLLDPSECRPGPKIGHCPRMEQIICASLYGATSTRG
jgi:hypothetical protein